MRSTEKFAGTEAEPPTPGASHAPPQQTSWLWLFCMEECHFNVPEMRWQSFFKDTI